jgi:4-aminobutyrate aminotransferase
MKNRLPEKAAEKGVYMIKRLREMQEENPIMGDVRGKGLMIGVELVKDEKKTPAKEETGRIRDAAREKGLLIGSGGMKGSVLRLQPPLVIEKDQMDKALSILEVVIKGVKCSK